MKHPLAAGLLALIVAGCSLTAAETEDIVIQTDRNQYFYGQTAELTFENRTDVRQRVVAATGCSTRLQRHVDGSWVSVPLQPGVDCSTVRVGTFNVAPGETAAASLRLVVDQDVLTDPPSEFRLETTIVRDGAEMRSLQSNPFRILIPKR